MQPDPPTQTEPAVDQTGGQWYTLKQAAEILGRKKSVIEYHAGKLDSSDKKTDAKTGVIFISGAAIDRIRQKMRTSTQQVPNKYQTAQEALNKYPTSTQETLNTADHTTQQVPKNYQTSTQQAPESSAEKAALNVLTEQIKDLKTELLQLKDELNRARETAAQSALNAAIAEERMDAERKRADKAEAEKESLKARNQSLTDQLAAIADKQADAIRADAGERLALAIPEQQEKTGFFARLFHRRKEKG